MDAEDQFDWDSEEIEASFEESFMDFSFRKFVKLVSSHPHRVAVGAGISAILVNARIFFGG